MINIGPKIGIDGEAKYRQQINDIITSTKALSAEYKALQTQYKNGKATIAQNKEAHRLLTEEIKKQEERVKLCKDMLDESKKKYGENASETDKWRQAVANAEKELGKFKQELDGIPSPLKQIGDEMKKAGEKMSSIGSSLTKTVTAPLVAVGVAGVKSFADVDKTMQLATKTMNATGEEADALGKAMKDAAANSTFGMEDAATATLNFARAGLDATAAADALAPAMNLAAGEGGNLDTVSGGLVATINSFGDSFGEAEHYADVFASACNNSALDVDSLADSMSIAAPIFSTAGYSVNDAALYMGVMANAGIDANKAANALKSGLAKLVSPAKDGAEMMAKLGISVTNADGTMKDTITVQSELHAAFAQLSESEQIAAASAIFGKEQMASWMSLINASPADVNALNDALANCAGTTQEMADTMMSGFGGSLEKLKSSLQVLVYTIGEKLAPFITKVADVIQGLVDKFNSLTPAQQETIVKIGMVVAAVGPLLLVIGKVITGIGSLMSAISVIGPAIAGLAGPVGIAVVAVGALMAAFLALYFNWDKVNAKADAWGKSVAQSFKKTSESIGKSYEMQAEAQMKVQNAQIEQYRAFGSSIKKAAEENASAQMRQNELTLQGYKALGSGIKKVANSAVDAQLTAQQTTMMGYQTLGDGIANAYDSIKTTIGNALKEQAMMQAENTTATIAAYGEMANGISQTWARIKNMASTGWGYVRNATSQGLSNFRNSLSQLWSGAQNVINRAINGFRNMIERIKGLFRFNWEWPKLKLPHFSFEGKFSLNPPSVPHLKVDWYAKAMQNGMILSSPTIFGAQGGKLLGAGEAGPEVVVGSDSLFGMIQRAVAAGTGTPTGSVSNSSYGDTIINVYGSEGQSVRELAREVGNILLGDYRRASVVWS